MVPLITSNQTIRHFVYFIFRSLFKEKFGLHTTQITTHLWQICNNFLPPHKWFVLALENFSHRPKDWENARPFLPLWFRTGKRRRNFSLSFFQSSILNIETHVELEIFIEIVIRNNVDGSKLRIHISIRSCDSDDGRFATFLLLGLGIIFKVGANFLSQF